MTELLTVSEIARLCRVHPHHVYRLVHERRIPYLKLGGNSKSAIRFRPDQIERWLNDYCVEPVNWKAELKRGKKAKP